MGEILSCEGAPDEEPLPLGSTKASTERGRLCPPYPKEVSAIHP